MADWFEDNFGWLLALFGVLVVVGLVWGVSASVENERVEREQFLNDCYKHRRPYECTAMWRAGNHCDDSSTVIPIVVPVGR